jgi:hypothetical protein
VEGTYSSDYSIASSTNSCSLNTIAVGTSCTFTVAFTPSTLNKETGSINIYDNAAGSPQAVTLTGQATAAQAKLSTNKLSFFTSKVETPSAAQQVTVTNTGTVPLLMESGCYGNPCVEGTYASDYSISNNTCSLNTIAVNTSCTFSVAFTPSTSNEETGSINIYDNTTSSPQSIAITGLATTATVSVSAKSLSFPAAGSGPLGLGVASAAQQVTVTVSG